MSRRKQQQGGVFILLGILVVVAVVFWLLKPLIGKIKQTRLQIGALSAQAQDLASRKAGLLAYKKDLPNARDTLDKIELSAPSRAQVAEIFIMLDSMATANGVALDSVVPQVKPEGGEVRVAVTLSGDFDKLTNFTKALSENIRLVSIHSVNVSRKTGEDASGLSAQLGLGFLVSENKTSDGGSNE